MVVFWQNTAPGNYNYELLVRTDMPEPGGIQHYYFHYSTEGQGLEWHKGELFARGSVGLVDAFQNTAPGNHNYEVVVNVNSNRWEHYWFDYGSLHWNQFPTPIDSIGSPGMGAGILLQNKFPDNHDYIFVGSSWPESSDHPILRVYRFDYANNSWKKQHVLYPYFDEDNPDLYIQHYNVVQNNVSPDDYFMHFFYGTQEVKLHRYNSGVDLELGWQKGNKGLDIEYPGFGNRFIGPIIINRINNNYELFAIEETHNDISTGNIINSVLRHYVYGYYSGNWSLRETIPEHFKAYLVFQNQAPNNANFEIIALGSSNKFIHYYYNWHTWQRVGEFGDNVVGLVGIFQNRAPGNHNYELVVVENTEDGNPASSNKLRHYYFNYSNLTWNKASLID